MAIEPEVAEEVVFEPIDETEAGIADVNEVPVAIIEEAVDETGPSYTTFDSDLDEQDFFAEIDEKIEEPGEFKQELLDESEDFETQTLTLPDEEETEELIAIEDGDDDAADPVTLEEADEPEVDEFFLVSEDDLSDLRTSIASLGVEINDTIIDGVLNDVNRLRQHLMDKPVDKTLLELISTIVQHIGQYGYESSAEAHGLLLSTFDKLEQIQQPETDATQAQELLLAETSKVLLWQQSMLDRQAIKKGDQLTFMDPLRSDSQLFAGEDSIADEADAIGDEPADQEHTNELRFGEIGEAVAEDLIADGQNIETGLELDSAAAEFIRQEMASLKESLRAEIESLRDQLKGRE